VFNVGGMELILIGLVALVVLGPDKLPGAMRQLGTAMGELRRISNGFRTDLRAALDEAERDAERRQRDAAGAASQAAAPATSPDGTAPDPGAAMAAAQAELDAIDAARSSHGDQDQGTEPQPSSDPAA